MLINTHTSISLVQLLCTGLQTASCILTYFSWFFSLHFYLFYGLGCGSGLSGETLSENGHHWIGYDISNSMLG